VPRLNRSYGPASETLHMSTHGWRRGACLFYPRLLTESLYGNERGFRARALNRCRDGRCAGCPSEVFLSSSGSGRSQGLPSGLRKTSSSRPLRLASAATTRGTSAGKRIRTAFRGAVKRAGLGERVPHPDKLKAQAGETAFTTDVTPHITRHTWAAWHHAQNRNLGALMELGGWNTVRMVMRYTHANVGHLSATMQDLPGGKF
jgi:hypothetical protein